MTTTVTRILAQSLLAGAPPALGPMRGNRMLHRGACAPGSATTLGLALGTERLRERLVRADGQTAAGPAPGCGTRRTHGTASTGPGRKLGVRAEDHRDRLTVGTRDRAVRAGQRDVVLGQQRPAVRPGTGKDGHAWRGPLGNPQARHIPQLDVPLEQTWALLPCLRQDLHGLMVRLLGRTDHRTRAVAVQVQSPGLFAAVARRGAARAAVAPVGICKGAAAGEGHVLLETPRARPPSGALQGEVF